MATSMASFHLENESEAPAKGEGKTAKKNNVLMQNLCLLAGFILLSSDYWNTQSNGNNLQSQIIVLYVFPFTEYQSSRCSCNPACLPG